MRSPAPGRGGAALRIIGSLWFAAVLLVVMLVALACATVFESMRSSEEALAEFYRAWWFEGLMALLGVNVVAALIVRYPFTPRKIGFVLTHASIPVVFIGALVTDRFGVNGQLGLAEGQSAEVFNVPEHILTVVERADSGRVDLDLPWIERHAFRAMVGPSDARLTLGDVHMEVERYLPDSRWAEKVVNDAPQPQAAFEVSLSSGGVEDVTWVFLGREASLGSMTVAFRTVADAAELEQLISSEPRAPEQSDGKVRIEYAGTSYAFAIEDCSERAVALGVTGVTVRVLRYLPHATVGPDNELLNSSPRPVNPAIEVEITHKGKTETRFAFARFPDFQKMHASEGLKDLEVFLDLPATQAPLAPIEVFNGQGDDTYVRFAWEGTAPATRKIRIGEQVDSPWPDKHFTILRRFERARLVRSLVLVEPARKRRVPALHVRVSTSGESRNVWVQRDRSQTLTIGGSSYELAYGEKPVALGFTVTLDRFRVGYYPGTDRPRSFESQISIVDPASGRAQSRIISMNHPAEFGGYTFYQSSYRLDGDRAISYLSVARDPGKPIVFTGYIGTILGMLVVLVTRVGDRRRDASLPRSALESFGNGKRRPVHMVLVEPGAQCQQSGGDGQRSGSVAGAVATIKR